MDANGVDPEPDEYVEDMGYESEYPDVNDIEEGGKMAEARDWEADFDLMSAEELVIELITTASKVTDLEEGKARTAHLIQTFYPYQDPDAERKDAYGRVV